MRPTFPILTLFLLIFIPFQIAAQENLLTNGGMEQGEFGPYTGRGRADLNIPAGWNIWLGQGSTDTFYNRGDKVYGFPKFGFGFNVAEGTYALHLDGSYVQFNSAVFQTVNVSEGDNVRGEAAAQIKACDGQTGSCSSNSSTGAQVRIGIDPNGGNDPNASEIVWSGWSTPHDRWERISVEATATGGQVTLFLFSTQGAPAVSNYSYWDDAKLTLGGGGGSAGEGGGESIPPTEVPNFVPFVNPQGVQEDGSIVHTVVQGDTLDSIAVAYGLTRQDIIDRNPDLQSTNFIRIGQELVIQEPQPATEVPDEIAAPPGTPISGGVLTEEPSPSGEEAAAVPTQAQATPTEPPLTILIPSESDKEVDVEGLLGQLFGEGQSGEQPAQSSEAEVEIGTPELAVTEAPAEAEPTEAAVVEPTSAPTSVAQAPFVAEEPQAGVNIASATVSICVSLFEDANQNRLRETNEVLLEGGTITISTGDDTVIEAYTTTGEAEPYCLTELPAGDYIAVVDAPEDYGLTTPGELTLPLTVGTALNLEFGALRGLETGAVVPMPGADLGSSADEVLPAEGDTLLDDLIGISGFIVAGLAGVVAVTGLGATILLRRG